MNDIDFVILWVDGNDPDWIADKNKYYKGELNQNKASNYRDWGTLKYWFRGIEKYAPWVRKVHFVTYGHLPPWLDLSNPKLHIVRHADMIPPDCLPTFSANAIELNINRIEGLSERFVYFNDDTFIINPMTPGDFFKNGLPIDSAVLSATIPSVRNEIFTYILFNDLLLVNLHFTKRDLYRHSSKWLNPRYGKSLFKNLYFWPLRKIPGFDNLHLPNAYLKSVWDKVWETEYDELNATVHRRFRTKQDVNQYIFKYWQLCEGLFEPGRRDAGKCYVIGQDNDAITRSFDSDSLKMICVNDSPDLSSFEDNRDLLVNLFDKKLPQKSRFEL